MPFKISVCIILGLIFNSESSRPSLCDGACVCRLQKHSDKDFLLTNVHCSYSGVTAENYDLPLRIHSLDLSATAMTKVVESHLFVSRTMEVLRLNGNNITTVEANAFNLPGLKELDLSENFIEVIDPEVFRRTKNLEYLNLASNRLKNLPPMLFHHLCNLNRLVLDYNDVGKSLREVDLFQRRGLALNNAISRLSLRGIGLDELPGNFFIEAYDLREVAISNNNLTSVPELPFTLEYLDISDNPIKEIFPEDFSELLALKTLKINNLLINEIPDFLFASMKTLINLEIERNKNLTFFSKLAFGVEALDDATYFTLERLSLRGSRLTSLTQELEVPLGRLSKLDLQGNPWRCDCKLVWMKELQLSPDEYEHIRYEFIIPTIFKTFLMLKYV